MLLIILFAVCLLIPVVYADFDESDVVMTVNGNDINRNLSTATSDDQMFRLVSGAKLTIT